jgi:hypothetical protein
MVAGAWLRVNSSLSSPPYRGYLRAVTATLIFSSTTPLPLRSVMREQSAFTYFAPYRVLVCCEHRSAVYGLDEHLKRYHCNMLMSKRRELLALYEDLYRLPPAEDTQPVPNGLPIDAVGTAKEAFRCCCSSDSCSSDSSSSSGSSGNHSKDSDSSVCRYISTSRVKMRQHVNQQHHVKLTRCSSPAAASYEEHAARLWKPVKVQTFFSERRYIRYFVVQEEEAEEEQQQGAQQPQCDYKRTRWEEHLQAYPDWKLLAYTVRPPGDDEPALKQVGLAVEGLVEQAVCGLDTLSIDTLRWLRSARPNEADARPLGRM